MSARSAFAVISTQYVVVNLEYLVPMCRAYSRLRFFVSCVWVVGCFFFWGGVVGVVGGGGRDTAKKTLKQGRRQWKGKYTIKNLNSGKDGGWSLCH